MAGRVGSPSWRHAVRLQLAGSSCHMLGERRLHALLQAWRRSASSGLMRPRWHCMQRLRASAAPGAADLAAASRGEPCRALQTCEPAQSHLNSGLPCWRSTCSSRRSRRSSTHSSRCSRGSSWAMGQRRCRLPASRQQCSRRAVCSLTWQLWSTTGGPHQASPATRLPCVVPAELVLPGAENACRCCCLLWRPWNQPAPADSSARLLTRLTRSMLLACSTIRERLGWGQHARAGRPSQEAPAAASTASTWDYQRRAATASRAISHGIPDAAAAAAAWQHGGRGAAQ